jgi:hypothetical protein
MGGWQRCDGVEEHVARPDLPNFEGLVATRTLVDEFMMRALGLTTVPNCSSFTRLAK